MDLPARIDCIATRSDRQFDATIAAAVAIGSKCRVKCYSDVSRAFSALRNKWTIDWLANQLDSDDHTQHDAIRLVELDVVVMETNGRCGFIRSAALLV